MNIESRYQIIEKAGTGGMATVYRARDTILNRDVAIKVLHPHLIEREEVKKRFLREAQAIARLKHKNIIEIYDYHSDENSCYIVSEYVKGSNLGRFLSEYDISSPFIAAMIVAVLADAIEHAHKSNVIHRDLKPENILISEDYQLKITDFGIAHIADAESLTITGSISGSPAHMSPEQIDGKEVDRRTDIFSLGTILYLISCGELPFKGNSATAIFKSILLGEYRDPKALNPLIDSRFASIIHRCLKKNLDERYNSAESLRSDLYEYLKDYGITNIEENLKRLFESPIEYIEHLNNKITEHLKDKIYKSLNKNLENRLQIQDYLNILLYLAPEDEDARALFERYSSIENQIAKTKRIRKTLYITFPSLLLIFTLYVIASFIKGSQSEDLKTDIEVKEIVDVSTQSNMPPSEKREENIDNQKAEKTEDHIKEKVKIKRDKGRLSSAIPGERSLESKKDIEHNQVRSGELSIYLKPYGDIYIDNNLVAKEKAIYKTRLKSGKHLIVARNPFFFDIKKEIEIEPDSYQELRLVFTEIRPAKIIINSPLDCDIYIDGILLGSSTMFSKNGITIPIDSEKGRKEILLKAVKKGYREFIRKIEVTAGQTRSIMINLERER